MNEYTFELAKTGTLSLTNYPDLPIFESQEQLWDFEENVMPEIAEEIILLAHDYLSDLGYKNEEIFGLEYGWFNKMRNNQVIIVETSIQGRSPPPFECIHCGKSNNDLNESNQCSECEKQYDLSCDDDFLD